MLVATFAARQLPGLQRLILASALASTELSSKGIRRLRELLPADVQLSLDKAEKGGDHDSPEHQSALLAFFQRFLCRLDPFPGTLMPALTHLGEDKTVYNTMWGPTPLVRSGSLLNWTCIPYLSKITAPTLVYNGEFDTSHDVATEPFFELIPHVRWITFANGGHMCHLEGDQLWAKIFNTVGRFLTQE